MSREFLGRAFHGNRFTHYVEIDVTGLGAAQGCPGVYVIPNEMPLDLTGRLLSSWKVPLE
ncbi:HYD1 signature containing ADP-ribosyltransferase family protein [Rhizobium leguminosarum]